MRPSSCVRSRPAARPVARRGAAPAAPRAGPPGVPPAEPPRADPRLGRPVVSGTVDAASRAPPLSTFAAMVASCCSWSGWRGCCRGPGAPPAPRSSGRGAHRRALTAAELRARAERALAEGRYGDAVVDGFRALAVRQVERGRLDDLPGATAHEVAVALAAEHPARASASTAPPRSSTGAVRRPAGDERAGDEVLGLDDRWPAAREHRDCHAPRPHRPGGRPGGTARACWSSAAGRRGRGRADPRRPGLPPGAARPRQPRPRRRPGARPGAGRPGRRREVARGADALEDAAVDAGTTVVVTSTDLLGQSTIERLLARVGEARLVLVEPGPGATEAFGLPAALRSRSTSRGPRTARTRRTPGSGAGRPGASIPSRTAASRRRGALLAEPPPGVVLLGAGEALTNDQVLRADNAAVALRLLGSRTGWSGTSRPSTTWSATTASASPPCCRLARPGALDRRARRPRAAAVAGAPARPAGHRAAAGRRQGHRDDPEPGPALPQGGRPCPRRGALRAARAVRAADRLGLGSRAGPAALVRDLARHTGRPVDEIAALLGPTAPPPPPTTT